MQNSIFTISALNSADYAPGATYKRRWTPWVWFQNLSQALDQIRNNTEFWAEAGYYDFFVIEEIRAHSIEPHKEICWFNAEWRELPSGRIVYDVVELGNRPDFVKHFCNFSMG